MTIQKAGATSSSTLDQTSYTQVNGMTLTPGAGDYLAIFTMDVEYNSSPGSEILKCAIFVNGTIVDHSEREIQQNSSLANMSCPMVTSALVSPTAGQVVEVRYIISGSSMTATNRELTLLPPNTTSFQDGDPVDDTIASVTWTTLDNMTRTPAANDYLLVFSCSVAPASTEVVAFRLSVGGTPVPHTVRQVQLESSADPSSYCVLIAASISPNGSQVVEIEWQRASGSGTQTCHERNMILVEVDSGDISQATGTVTDTDSTSGSDVLIDDMTITDPGASYYLALFSSYQMYGSLGSPGAGSIYKFYSGGGAVSDSDRYFEHEDSIDNTDLPVFAAAKVTILGATDDLQMYWQGDQTDIRSLYTRTLVLVKDPDPPPLPEFPIVAAFNTSGDSGTTPSVALPAGISAGDLLFIFIATDGDNTVTNWNGFTMLGTESNGTANSFHVGYKKATGGEGGSVTITLSVSEPSRHISYRITGMEDPTVQAPEISTVAEASSNSPNPTIVTPTGGAQDYLWIHADGWDRDRTVTGWESNFANDRLSSVGGGAGGCGCAVSTMPDNVASKDPGAITISNADTWIAWTIVVHPAGPSGTTYNINVTAGVTVDAADVLITIFNIIKILNVDVVGAPKLVSDFTIPLDADVVGDGTPVITRVFIIDLNADVGVDASDTIVQILNVNKSASINVDATDALIQTVNIQGPASSEANALDDIVVNLTIDFNADANAQAVPFVEIVVGAGAGAMQPGRAGTSLGVRM